MWRHQKGNSLLSAVKFILQTRPVGVNKPAHLMPGICVFGSGQRGIRGEKKFKTHSQSEGRFSEADPKLVGAFVWPFLNCIAVNTTQKLLTDCNALVDL